MPDPTITATSNPPNVGAAASATTPDPAAALPTPAPTTAPDSSGNLFQGSALPATTTTTQTQVTAPDFYTNYLQDIANLGQNAVNQGGVAGFSPLQQQAFQMAPQAAFSGADTAASAADMYKQAGSTSAPSVVNQYLNPYMRNVVDEMGRLQSQNIQRNVMPALTAAGVGSGGFGSKRQLSATGQTLADMQANLTGQQYGALNTGYQNAMSSAQTDLSRLLNAGQGMGNLAQQQYNIGTGGLNELSTLGALQQAQGQKMLDYPMAQAQAFSKLLQSYQIPTGSTQQTVAPGQQGQFTNSPLSQIAGLGTLLASLFPQQNTAQNAQAGYYQALTNQIANPTAPTTNPNDLAAALTNQTAAAKNLGYTTYDPLTGSYSNPTNTAAPKIKYDATTGQFVQAPKDGGLIRSYADGGVVDPSAPVDPTQQTIDPTLLGLEQYIQPVVNTVDQVATPLFDPNALPMPVFMDPTTTTDPTLMYATGAPTPLDPNAPPVMYMSGPTATPTGGQVFAGGTPNFNEATGTYMPRGTLPYERTTTTPAPRRPGYDAQGNFIGMGNDVRSPVAPGVVDKSKRTAHQKMLETAKEARRVAQEYKQEQERNRIREQRQPRQEPQREIRNQLGRTGRGRN